jgi:adenine phosphoribosyltransferase
MHAVDLREHVRDVPGFPKPGIVFKDITPLLRNPAAMDAAISGLSEVASPLRIEFVVAPEARGFILGGALANRLGAGFVPARRPGKLPQQTVEAQYQLEYGLGALELHIDALAGGARVLVHDDLLATGGTVAALCELISRLGADVVACAFLVELSYLGGRARLRPYPVHALIDYPD